MAGFAEDDARDGALDGLLQCAIVVLVCLSVWWAHVAPQAVDRQHPLGILTGIWTHVNAAHLVDNMVALCLAAVFAQRRALVGFLASAVVANVVWVLAAEPAATGASGGVFGVAGVGIATQMRHRRWARAAGLGVGTLVALNGMHASWVAHGTGLFCGLLIGALADWHRAADSIPRHRHVGRATGLQAPCGQGPDGGDEQEGEAVARTGGEGGH